MASILVVDDERSMRDFLKILLQKEGHQIQTAENASAGIELFNEHQPDLIVSDIRMPKGDGFELLAAVKAVNPEVPVILITAFAAPNDAVLAMKNGAFDYISKPFNVDEIKSVINSAIQKNCWQQNVSSISDTFPGIIGESREMLKIFDMISRIGPTPANVLIYGESGTGKELVAKAIHDHSKVAKNNFVPITCSAIPNELMESELFGHVKGAFTGAIDNKPGLFNEADGGTAFLDEIGELPAIIQTKLLRVLQEREIKPVGGNRIQKIDVRIVAATNRVLEKEIKEGRFREDLFYRLAVVPLRVPPLRERKSDIPLLARHFLEKYSRRLQKEVQEISSYALEVLMKYEFPGNVRELENIIERGVALETSNIILPENLTLSGVHSEQSAPNPQYLADDGSNIFQAVSGEEELFDLGLETVITNLEKRLITHALEKTGNSKIKAADLLQVSFRSLRYKIKKYNIG